MSMQVQVAHDADQIPAQLFLGLADANRSDKILAALQRNEAVLHSIDRRQSEAQNGHVISRIELFSVFGRRCALVYTNSGSVVLYQMRIRTN